MAQRARHRDGMGRAEKKNIQKEGERERGGGEEEDFEADVSTICTLP